MPEAEPKQKKINWIWVILLIIAYPFIWFFTYGGGINSIKISMGIPTYRTENIGATPEKMHKWKQENIRRAEETSE